MIPHHACALNDHKNMVTIMNVRLHTSALFKMDYVCSKIAILK